MDQLTQQWRTKQDGYQAIRESGKVVIFIKGSRINVVVPYNQEFRVFCNALSGQWRQKSGFWSFKRAALIVVREKAEEIYGKENVGVN